MNITEYTYYLVRQIPSGRVSTYGAVAKALGNPGYARAVGKIMNNPEAREDNLPDILNELKSRKSNVKELLSEYEKPEYKENEKALTYFSKNFKNLVGMGLTPETSEKYYKENKHVEQLVRNLVKLRNLEQKLSKGEEKIKSLMN